MDAARIGMDKWSRRQLHSHSYRVPDSFHGEVVVIVGFRHSGVDIALELSKVAREVHVSVKSMEALTPAVSKAVARHSDLHLHLQERKPCSYKSMLQYSLVQNLIQQSRYGR
jgi:cation diffusion facilitator CzcD-associated flavoprotein CzcO